MNKEELVRDPAGREWWHLVIKTPLRAPNGQIVGLVGVSRNIQELKETEAALRAGEAMLRGAFDDTNVPMVITALDHRFLRVNAAFARLFGYSQAEMLNMSTADVTYPDDLAESYARREVLLAGESHFVQQKRYLHCDGHLIWGVTSVSLVRDATGKPQVYVGQVQDITDRKAAEDELRASEERFRLVVDGVRDYAVFMLDPAGNVLTWNSGAERILGHTGAEILSRHYSVFYQPEDLDVGKAEEELRRAALRGRVEDESWQLRKDGTRFWAGIVITVLRDAAGTLRGFTQVVRDLTERRRLEDQFRQAQKMEAIGRLAGGVAHDFNNLLTVINMCGQLLLEQLHPLDSARQFVNEIASAGERATGLTAKLLAFSRKAIVEPRVLDLNEVVVHSEGLLGRLLGEDVSLATSLDPQLYTVKVDPTHAEQIVINLAVNARDAMPRGGHLTIETRNMTLREEDAVTYPDLPCGRYVQLAVSDTGIGMSDEVKTRIFEPFFTTKDIGKGTGLGLAMVYGAVKTHRGHIAVYSEVGVGTTFKILLPVTNEAKSAPQSGELKLASRGSETILLVEDEESVRRLAHIALEIHGYTVLEASGGPDAVRLAAEYAGPIHLLLSDVVMPEMGGREVAETVRLQRPGLKVLFASGYTDDAVVRHGIVEATDAFLQKPFTPSSLARKVRAVLDGTN